MSDTAAVAAARARHFGEPLLGRYPLRAVSHEDYWAVHDAALEQFAPDEAYFARWELLDAETARRYDELMVDRPPRHGWLGYQALDGETAVAQFCGAGAGSPADVYRQQHAIVHPDWRRRGIYSEITRRLVAFAAELGYLRVQSEHSPYNNAILIAKLRAGFHVSALEIDAEVGTSVVLTRFLSEAHERAFAFRCGHAALDGRHAAAGNRFMDALGQQLSQAGSE